MKKTLERGDRQDVTTQHERDLGFKVVRVCTRHEYARNGNVHNPTPVFIWEVYQNERLLGTVHARKQVKSLIYFASN